MGGKGMEKRCFRLVLHISLIELLSDSITAPRLFASCRQCSHIPVRLKTRCKAQTSCHLQVLELQEVYQRYDFPTPTPS